MGFEMFLDDPCDSPDAEVPSGLRTAECEESLDKSSVAELSAAVLVEMTPAELITVIRAAKLPGYVDSNFDRHPDRYDRPTLLRFAHIARRSCRNQGY